jgi:transitional endoplasmic reticulum ATPase
MSKHLNDMPDDVWLSAWRDSDRWFLRPLMWIWTGMFWVLALGTYFAWWVPAYWVLLANIPADVITEGIPKVRNFICWSYLGFGALSIFMHWYDLQLSVPRKDKDYPLVEADWFTRDMIRKLGFHVLGFAILLWLAVFMRSHGTSSSVSHLVSAVVMLGLAAGLLVYSYRPLTYGLRVPSEAEVQAALAAREQRLLTPPSAAAGAAAASDYATPVEKRDASLRFSDIFGMQEIKEKLLAPAQRVLTNTPRTEPAPNGILLHGEPGNGKTVFAEALAGELGIPFVELTYGAVSSKWIGEVPRVITNCFTYARRNAPCVLFVDEIDSFIRSRDEYSNNSEDQKVTNTLLTEIVSLRKHQVVLVGATNFLDKLDPAAIREGRFDYKVEITPPDEQARVGMLLQGVDKYARELMIDRDAATSVAQRWKGFSASRLMAVVKALPEYARERGIDRIGYEDWIAVLRTVQGRKGKVPESSKTLDELVLDSGTCEALTLIANRLKDVSRIEALGGSLPTGVLFYGPSGTGKTATARALAKACGWSFLAVSGPELVADRERLPALYVEAKDLRPTLVFIDEADDVLRDRRASSTPDITNRLLVLMDGIDDRVQDVVFVAATNHPEQIDPALLRAGRFTEKVEFIAPAHDQVPQFVTAWLQEKKVLLGADVDPLWVAHAVRGETIANIEGILQYALNRAIEFHREGRILSLSRDDIESAVRVVSLSKGFGEDTMN